MTFGPRTWVQCSNDAVVMLTVTQDEETTDQPSCTDCWNKAIEKEIDIVSVRPLTEEEKTRE